MQDAPQFERMLVDSGVHVIKFWFSVSRKEQRRRFQGTQEPSAQAVEALAD